MADQRVRIIIEGRDTTASAALDNVEKKAKSLQSSLAGIGQGMTSFGSKMTLGVTAPILGFAGAAIKAAADQEPLQVAFTTMLGSAEAAKTMMAELSQFAATTPFESPEIQNASKMLLAFGINAKGIIPTMTNLGDIAAGLNIPLADMAYLFGTTRASGRLMTADLNQFTTRGIPMIAALAKVMNVAEGDIKGLVEAGKVGFPEVQAALQSLTSEGGQFAGLMAAQSQTLSGLFSTLSDTVGLTLAEVGKVIIDTFDLKTKLAGALEWLGQAKGALLGFAQTNPELFRLGIIIAGVAAAIGPLIVGVGLMVSAFSAALPVLGAIGGALGLLLSPIGLVVAGLAALVAFDVGGIRTALVGLGTEGAAAFGKISEAIGRFVESSDVSTALEGLKTSFGGVRTTLSDLFTGDIGVGEFVQRIQEAVSGIPGLVQDMFSGADFAALRGEIVAALGLDQIDFSQVIASFQSFGQQLAAEVSNFDFAGAFAGLQTIRTELEAGANSLRDGAIQAVTGAINGIDWSQASLNVAGMISWVTEKINAIDWSQISIANIGAALAGVVAPALMAGIKAIVWVLDSDAWTGFVSAVKNAFSSIQWGELGESLAGLGAAVIGAITEIDWSPVTAGLDSLKTTIATAVASIDWTAVAESITTGLETLKTGANTLRDDVLANLSSSFEQMDLTGAFTGFIDSITTAITTVNWTNVGAAVGQALSVALDPATLQAAFATAVAAVVPALTAAVAGITWIMSSENFSGLISSIGTAITNIDWSSVTASFEGFKTAVNKAMSDFVAGFTGGKGFQAPEWLTTLNESVAALTSPPAWVDAIKSIVDKLFGDPGWVSTIKSIVDKLFGDPGWVSVIRSVVDKLFGTPGWVDSVKSTVSKLFSTPGWISSLQTAVSSLFSTPGWLTSFQEAVSNLLGWVPDLNPFDSNATGTNFYRGGWTWVGEHGPELIHAPRGAQVMNHERSMAYATAGAGYGSGDIHNTFIVNNALDVQEVAYQVADIIRRRR